MTEAESIFTLILAGFSPPMSSRPSLMRPAVSVKLKPL